MIEHTPTPWNISHVRTTEDTAMIVGGEGFEPIADVAEDGDAAFIVQAVNNHDALVRALEYVLGFDHGNCLRASQECRDVAREALDAAGSPGKP